MKEWIYEERTPQTNWDFCYRMMRNDLKVRARLLQVFNPESNIDFVVVIWPR